MGEMVFLHMSISKRVKSSKNNLICPYFHLTCMKHCILCLHSMIYLHGALWAS